MVILIGCDHNAYHLKEELKAYLLELGHEPVDVGGGLVGSGAATQRGHVGLGLGEGLGANALEKRLLHQPETDVAGQVVDRRVAALGRGGDPIEERRQLRHTSRAAWPA